MSDRNKQSESDAPKTLPLGAIVVIGLVLFGIGGTIPIVIWGLIPWGTTVENELGILGDMFGAANALLSAGALVYIIYEVGLQRVEMYRATKAHEDIASGQKLSTAVEASLSLAGARKSDEFVGAISTMRELSEQAESDGVTVNQYYLDTFGRRLRGIGGDAIETGRFMDTVEIQAANTLCEHLRMVFLLHKSKVVTDASMIRLMLPEADIRLIFRSVVPIINQVANHVDIDVYQHELDFAADFYNFVVLPREE